VLKYGPFARYMTGEVISMMGTWMQMMAQAWVVTGLTSSNFTLGMLNFASGIPMLIFASWGGVMADRLDKRHILLVTQVIQIVLAVALGWLVLTHTITVWYILVAGVCLGISTAFEMPAASALIPELVGRERLRAAISVDRSLFHATRTAGPALGGWLMHALGTASAFFANATSFLAMIVALYTLPPRTRGTEEEEACDDPRGHGPHALATAALSGSSEDDPADEHVDDDGDQAANPQAPWQDSVLTTPREPAEGSAPHQQSLEHAKGPEK